LTFESLRGCWRAPQVTPEFTVKDQKVRVVMIEGGPWSVVVNVTKFLGIERVD